MADYFFKFYFSTWNDSKVEYLRGLENGDTYFTLFLKLICAAGELSDGGSVYITPQIPHTPETLGKALNRTPEIIEKGLSILVELQMIQMQETGIITVNNWEKFRDRHDAETLARKREQARQASQRYRDKKKTEESSGKPSYDDHVTETSRSDNGVMHTLENRSYKEKPSYDAIPDYVRRAYGD